MFVVYIQFVINPNKYLHLLIRFNIVGSELKNSAVCASSVIKGN
jgi:hypothetical protein